MIQLRKSHPTLVSYLLWSLTCPNFKMPILICLLLVLWKLRVPRHATSPDMGLQEEVETSMLSDGSQFLRLRYLMDACRPWCRPICGEDAHF